LKLEKKSLLVLSSLFVVLFLNGNGLVAMANGPQAQRLLFHFYNDSNLGSQDLEIGILDINDWSLSSDWYTMWLSPAYYDNITMRERVAYGMFEFDLYCQKWPTGWPGYFDPLNARHEAARHFRIALAHLANKPKIVSDILKGFAEPMIVPLPPQLGAYLFENAKDYEYSRSMTLTELAAGGFYYENGLWKWTGGEVLPKLKIYLRLDDPNRRYAGEYLVSELRAIGFTDAQLDVKILERNSCFYNVMARYDYNVYTAGWTVSAAPYELYDLYHSKFYVDFGAPEQGWATNYVGWCDNRTEGYDYWTERVRYAASEQDLRYACWNATKIFHDNEPTIPLWSPFEIRGYKKGSTGVVNSDLFGVNNAYTFLRMAGTSIVDGKIDCGLVGEPEALNVISSSSELDRKIIGLVYDSLIGRNPYSIENHVYWLATDLVVGTWNNGTHDVTELTFTLRSDVKWHDGTAFTADDVIFSWNFTKACGPKVAYNYAQIYYYGAVADMYNCTIIDSTHVNIKYGVKSVFAKWWSGTLPILPKHIWEARFPDWNLPSFNPYAVRAYQPWMERLASNETLTEMIGTGPWYYTYGNWTKGQSIQLYGWNNYYLSPSEIDDRVTESFWQFKGDATAKEPAPYDVGKISGYDITLVTSKYDTDYPGCDFNGNGVVDAQDFSLVTSMFDKEAG